MSTELFACPLTDDEAQARAYELACLVRKMDEEETAAKGAAAAARDTMKEMDAELRRLARIVREQKEDREVEVIVRQNTAEASIETVRTDTGAVVRSRPMTAEERQIPLYLVPEEA